MSNSLLTYGFALVRGMVCCTLLDMSETYDEGACICTGDEWITLKDIKLDSRRSREISRERLEFSICNFTAVTSGFRSLIFQYSTRTTLSASRSLFSKLCGMIYSETGATRLIVSLYLLLSFLPAYYLAYLPVGLWIFCNLNQKVQLSSSHLHFRFMFLIPSIDQNSFSLMSRTLRWEAAFWRIRLMHT